MRISEVTSRQRYVDGLYAQEDAGLNAVRERLVTAGRWGVNIGANEGKMLQILLRLISARKVVEIGTLFGYSAVWMARALPVDGHLFTIERDHDCVRMARKAFAECRVEEQVTLLEGEAIEKLKELESQGPFDLVFIDANKSDYVHYLDWATRFVRRGGLIVADNTLLGGGVAEPEKPASLSNRQYNEMRLFNEKISDASTYLGTVFPTSEGLTVAIKL